MVLFKMIRRLIIVGIFVQVFSGGEREFRFDYEFSTDAGGWLKFHVVPGTWREARLRCNAEGAVLASPLNSQLKSGLISLVTKHKGTAPTKIFTGVHASFSKGDYSSIEGVPLLKLSINWAPGEPDNYNNTESCLAMDSDCRGSISDVRCGDVLPYICYKEDANLTMTECGTTDPEYFFEPRTGSCYKMHTSGVTWQQAYMTCVAEGGHLVIIDSKEEKDMLRELYNKYPEKSIFSTSRHTMAIGFHDWGERVSFMTIHGKPVEKEFLKWPEGEPNNLTNSRTFDQGEFCGSVYRQNAEINDVLCNIPISFLCEKKPDSLLSNTFKY